MIEIVGTRFMRQMVRVLVASAVREAAKLAECQLQDETLAVADAGADAGGGGAGAGAGAGGEGGSDKAAATDYDALLRYAQLPSTQPELSVSEIRAATAPPAPALGLCFASVGYE
jgi:hypothetical protein